ncbi:MAG: DUF4350 domain-containing protein [Desulfurococcales archaeon]|nr:DUF4350 domain-containing protein [Desulfurococcales archaeon]
MRLRASYVALIIVVIALNAALEAMPKDVVISTGFNPLSASPRNPGPYGTSDLVALLQNEGFKVLVIASLQDLAYALPERPGRLVISVIAPDRISPGEREALLRLARQGNVSILVATENTENVSTGIAEDLSLIKCGTPIFLPAVSTAPYRLLYNASRDSALVVSLPGEGRVDVVATGYVAPVIPGPPRNATEALKKAKLPPESVPPIPLGEIYVIAEAVLPASEASEPLVPQRFTAGIACRSNRGALVVIGDSTIFTNMLIGSRGGRYADLALSIYRYLAGNGRATVVFIADLYSRKSYSLALKFHPSVLLTAAALRYKSLEASLASYLALHPLGVLGVVAGLSLAAYAAMPRELRARPPRRRRQQRRLEGPPAFIGGSAPKRPPSPGYSVEEICLAADRILRSHLGFGLTEAHSRPRLLETIRDPETRRLVAELLGLCAEARRGGLWRRLAGALGLDKSKSMRASRLLEMLASRLGAE